MATIAIVDDDRSLSRKLEIAFADRGHSVLRFEQILEASDRLFDSPPQLVICEAELPDGSGLELIARLRQIRQEQQLPIVILSRRASEACLIRGYAAGANDYLIKPVRVPVVLAKCARLLSESQRVALPRPLPNSGEQFAGRYLLGPVLGEGSFGRVYEAVDEQSGLKVALKILAAEPGEQPENRMRFMREAYAVAAVRSPYVVKADFLGECGGHVFCAQEFVEGPTLGDHVHQHGPGTEIEIVALLRGMGRALQALDAADLVHRDIKPGNIVLRGGRYDSPVLLDFGLAKRPLDHGLTTPDMLFGTAGYMSPEYIAGDPLSPRSDLFSTGVLAYFVAKGFPPFPHLKGMQLIMTMSAKQVPIPKGLSPGLRGVLELLLRLDPRTRCASATELLESLGRLAPPVEESRQRLGGRRTPRRAKADAPTLDFPAEPHADAA